MNNPLISIIVPVYNVEKYLGRCIDSILSQTFTNFELLLIDDGSIDLSAKICDEYVENDSRIRVFHQENRGVSSARNSGINAATGKWIWFIDSDDYLENFYLSTLYHSLIQFDPDIIFFGSNECLASGDKTIHLPAFKFCNDPLSIQEEIYHLKSNEQNYGYFGYTWGKLFRKPIIEKANIRFNQEISFMEDALFTMEYCKYIRSLLVVDKALYNYRIVNSGLARRTHSCREYMILAQQTLDLCASFSVPNLVQTDKRTALLFAYRACMLSNSRTEQMQAIKLFLSFKNVCKRESINLPQKVQLLLSINNRFSVYIAITAYHSLKKFFKKCNSFRVKQRRYY